MLFVNVCTPSLWAGGVPCLFQEQIPAEVPQRQGGQSVWPLLCRAQEKRWITALHFHFEKLWKVSRELLYSITACQYPSVDVPRTPILFLPLCYGINSTVCVCVDGSVSGACGNSSPRTHRASRPLSAVFQSLQPPNLWKSRKSTSSLNQVDYISICHLYLYT